MINFDDVSKETIKEHNPNSLQTSENPYKILIIWSFGSRKINLLFSLISHQPDIDSSYLYAKNLFEAKYQLLINKHERKSLKCFNNSNAFIECSSDMDGIYKNIEDNNPHEKRKTLIVFGDMIVDMLSNGKLKRIVNNYLLQVENLTFFFVFIT